MEDEACTIPIMYDDFFLILYDYLNLQEKVRFSQTCTSLENVFIEYIKKKIPPIFNNELLETIKEFPKDDLLQFWRHFGSHVEAVEMTGTPPNNRIVFSMTMHDAIQKYCTNLKRIKLINVHRLKYIHFLNATNLQTINEVDLSDFDMTDRHLESLTTLPSLRILSLSCHRNAKCKPIIRMRQITHLTLRSCGKLSQGTLVDICIALELQYLNIRDNCFNSLNGIVRHCKELEDFRFSWAACSNPARHIGITALPKLKSLTIYLRQTESIPDYYIRSLAKHHKEDLKELKLYVYFAWHDLLDGYKNSWFTKKRDSFQAQFKKVFYELKENEVCENSVLELVLYKTE